MTNANILGSDNRAVNVGLRSRHYTESRSRKLTSGKSLTIETHSEHIMLRLLRRVRQRTEGEVPPGVLGLTPDDLSVIYVESSVEGVQGRPKQSEFTSVITILVLRLRSSLETDPPKSKDCY